MNPFEATADPIPTDPHRLNGFGWFTRGLGYVILTPAIMLSFTMLLGIVLFAASDGRPPSVRGWWTLGMSVAVVVLLVTSHRITRTDLRFLMYLAGAATVFCAAIADTHNVVELNAYSGCCGNPIMAGLMTRSACLSTFVAVPLIAIAGLTGISTAQREQSVP